MEGIEGQEQLRGLKDEMQETDNKQRCKRYPMVWPFLTGKYSKKDRLWIEGVIPKTVASQVTAYLTGGLDALKPKSIPGRVCRLTPAQEDELAQTMDSAPFAMGVERLANWTLALAVKCTRKTWDVEYSLTACPSALRVRASLIQGQPNPWQRQTRKKPAEFNEELFPEIKKLIRGEVSQALFADKSRIPDYQAMGKIWF